MISRGIHWKADAAESRVLRWSSATEVSLRVCDRGVSHHAYLVDKTNKPTPTAAERREPNLKPEGNSGVKSTRSRPSCYRQSMTGEERTSRRGRQFQGF